MSTTQTARTTMTSQQQLVLQKLELAHQLVEDALKLDPNFSEHYEEKCEDATCELQSLVDKFQAWCDSRRW